ncbi:hypothetical protein GF340_02210 [Candidatus Peregrinibacteria bacterium]|nr:hypothetical protein [Candidatus Peregrinibacteria bacterium]
MTEYKKFNATEKPEFLENKSPSKETLPSASELREKLKDHKILPKRKEVEKAFPTYELWYEYFSNETEPVFDVLTEEYIEKLSDYLTEQIEKYGANTEKPLVILEIGAGNGKLSHFLKQKINEKAPGKAKVIATDSGEWNLKQLFEVEKINHKDALQKYQPDITLFSWMPHKEDLTKDTRKCKNLKEYILIGESDGGCCGDPYETWGRTPWQLAEEGIELESPYEKDGFYRKNHPELRKLQMSRMDNPGQYYHSNTVSFIRK